MLKLAPQPERPFTWKKIRQAIRRLPSSTVKGLREFSWADLRWTYLVTIGLIAIAAAIHLFAHMPYGWTVWPLVPAIAAMVAVNEAADRNAQGVPPLEVYVFFVGAMGVWAIGVILLNCVNIVVQIMAFVALASYVFDGYRKHRRQIELRMQRRQDGCCIHCGEPDQESNSFCEGCGEEPDPERLQLQRISEVVRHGNRNGRARAILQPESHAASAARKERELLARAPHRRAKPPKRGK
jgi:hypothetical protein